jgi:curved DNA-binding protein CbpA
MTTLQMQEKKRIEIMIQRRLGLHHRRQQELQAHTNSSLSYTMKLSKEEMTKNDDILTPPVESIEKSYFDIMREAAVSVLNIPPAEFNISDIDVAKIAHRAMQNVIPKEVSNNEVDAPRLAISDTRKRKQHCISKTKKKSNSKASSNMSSSLSNEKNMNKADLPIGTDAESRRQRRLIRNRLSAQLHRERKREAMEALQNDIEIRENKITSLEKQIEIVSVDLIKCK